MAVSSQSKMLEKQGSSLVDDKGRDICLFSNVSGDVGYHLLKCETTPWSNEKKRDWPTYNKNGQGRAKQALLNSSSSKRKNITNHKWKFLSFRPRQAWWQHWTWTFPNFFSPKLNATLSKKPIWDCIYLIYKKVDFSKHFS